MALSTYCITTEFSIIVLKIVVDPLPSTEVAKRCQVLNTLLIESPWTQLSFVYNQKGTCFSGWVGRGGGGMCTCVCVNACVKINLDTPAEN